MTSGEKIKALKKRRDYLARRIAESKYELSFDKAEHSALCWAIEELEKLQIMNKGVQNESQK